MSDETAAAEEAEHQVGLLARAIVDIAKAAGVIEVPPLTGPQVLLLAEETAQAVKLMRAIASDIGGRP